MKNVRLPFVSNLRRKQLFLKADSQAELALCSFEC